MLRDCGISCVYSQLFFFCILFILDTFISKKLARFKVTYVNKYNKYGYLKLHDACTDIREMDFSIRKVARLHGLPESTLRRGLANNKGEELKRGGQALFARTQEELLAEHCVAMANIDYGFSSWQILEMAKNMKEAIGGDGEPHFLTRFLEIKMVHPKKR